ncbi:MAG: hypothetical protein JST00_17315 [Deltaproteobacteria bacterium]|nr:hypothetical protein [Deltaproteobacteria bacterium]
MAKANQPATTHVIEIETGIGEPAFIPLSMGHELQPISVGKKGMWRIESPRVLDVHAFVYFDGNALFLQSADEQSAASVDGYRVGKAWTELHAPCKIEIGSARLRFRSLIADAEQATVGLAQPPVAPPPMNPPMPGPGQAPPPGMGLGMQGTRPPQPMMGADASPMQTGPQPAPQGPGGQPVSFPKADRPFKPGEFSAKADDESTRIAPLESTGGNRIPSGNVNAVRPAAGAPMGERLPTGPMPQMAMGSGPYGAVNAGPMMQNGMMPMMPPGGAPPPPGSYPAQVPGAPGSYPGQGQNAYAQGPFSQPPGMMPQQGPPMMGPGGPSMPPGGFGSMTPQGGSPPAPGQGGNDFLTKLKETPIPIKTVAMVLILIASGLYLLDDDEEPAPKKKPVATLDGGAADGGKVAAAGGGVISDAGATTNVPPVATPGATGTQPPAWPPGVPCPPPNWPPNTPLPCTPNDVKPEKPEKPGHHDAGSAVTSNNPATKTLERQAVDYVAAGDMAKAAAAYEELTRRDPKNPVYAEAARILRNKLDGGAP